jgi:hypothetical protein
VSYLRSAADASRVSMEFHGHQQMSRLPCSFCGKLRNDHRGTKSQFEASFRSKTSIRFSTLVLGEFIA